MIRSKNLLQQLGILITRPIHQSHTLAEKVCAASGTPWLLPCMAIEPPQNMRALEQFAAEYLTYDILIFTSTNAVNSCRELLLRYTTEPKNKTEPKLQIFAIGSTTANALLTLGLPVIVADTFNSERLLTHPLLQSCQGKKIALLAGEGGRDLLLQTLKERKALVIKTSCYRRVPTNVDPTPLLTAWQAGKIHIVTATSAESLAALKNLLSQNGLNYLFNTPLVVLSERIRQFAALSWQQDIWVADNACEDSLFAAIVRCAQEFYNRSSSDK